MFKKKKEFLPAWPLLSVAQTSLLAKPRDYKLPEIKNTTSKTKPQNKKKTSIFNNEQSQTKNKLEKKKRRMYSVVDLSSFLLYIGVLNCFLFCYF